MKIVIFVLELTNYMEWIIEYSLMKWLKYLTLLTIATKQEMHDWLNEIRLIVIMFSRSKFCGLKFISIFANLSV